MRLACDYNGQYIIQPNKVIHIADDPVYVRTTAPQGWQCPICKVVYAPTVTMCMCEKVKGE